MKRGTARRPPAARPEGPRPWRTCLGCRRVRPQAALLRLVRTAHGTVEPDPSRRRPGRGAYVCRAEACLDQALRRGRWAHAFRAPAVMSAETAGRVRELIGAEGPARPASERTEDGACVPATVEGGW